MKNYLFDLYPNFPNDFNLGDRKDPDKESKSLYVDLNATFFDLPKQKELGLNSVYNKEQGYKKYYYTLFVNGDDILLSSDYIGPSIKWAQKAKLTDEEIISFLKISRTLGGHIVFPRGSDKNVTHVYKDKDRCKHPITMNIARGGAKGYFDRFDKTLYAIKQLFEGQPISNENVWKAWDNYTDWFEHFGKETEAFTHFIEFFKLHSFVNDNNEIYDLTSYDAVKNSYEKTINDDKSTIPTDTMGYKKYVQGALNAISLRNDTIGL